MKARTNEKKAYQDRKRWPTQDLNPYLSGTDIDEVKKLNINIKFLQIL